ncbi:hypothetical protein CDN98_07385 [Roseateles terrae]|nr:hypothetical protein CDN98_07385 [Roseateles terrae]
MGARVPARALVGACWVFGTLSLAACGGGSTPPPPPTQTEIIVADGKPCAVASATPASGATGVLVNIEPSVVYTGPGPDVGPCGIRLTDAAGATVPTRTLVSNQAADPDGGVIGTHTLQPLEDLTPDSAYSVYRGTERLYSFTTGRQKAGVPVSVTDQPAGMKGIPANVIIQPAQINNLLEALALQLVNDKAILAKLVDEVLSVELPKLARPGAQYAVRLQKMTYTSSVSEGYPVTLSGLVALPVNADGSPLDYSRMPVLISQRGAQDGTAAAPSSASQVGLIPALLGAGKGHIVLSPDLIGVGDSAPREQAYLVSKDTAAQTRDMLVALREHLAQQYGATASQDLRIVGSSQGGHSVMASLPYLTPLASVKLVNTLAGPFNVDRTFNGAILAIAGEPRDAYAAHENLALAPQRLRASLDALMDYQSYRYDEAKIFDANGGLRADFLTDYQAGKYNALRAHWRVNSMTSNSQVYNAPQAKVVMYHFSTDALVPAQNTADMVARLRAGGSSLASVTQADCREKSVLTELVLKFSESPLKTHTICAVYQYNDLVGDL